MNETLVRITTPSAVFGVVIRDAGGLRRVVACAPYGRKALIGRTATDAFGTCRRLGWRTEVVRCAVSVTPHANDVVQT